MNELIRTHEDEKGNLAVSGRELHKFLEAKTEYKKWFDRMAAYGFTEGTDFQRVSQKCPTLGGVQTVTDHKLTISMAKELCMIQRTDKGKEARQYFIQVEDAWNTPEMVMHRALTYSNQQVQLLMNRLEDNQRTLGQQQKQIETQQSRISDLESVMNMMATDTLTAESSRLINRMIHLMAGHMGIDITSTYNKFYDCIEVRYGIYLRRRDDSIIGKRGNVLKQKKSLLQRLKSDEWAKVTQCLISLMTKHGVDLSSISVLVDQFMENNQKVA